jgi:hypothetical protein
MIISEEAFAMLLVEPFFRTFIKREIGYRLKTRLRSLHHNDAPVVRVSAVNIRSYAFLKRLEKKKTAASVGTAVSNVAGSGADAGAS